jgi:hypothetical protein
VTAMDDTRGARMVRFGAIMIIAAAGTRMT